MALLVRWVPEFYNWAVVRSVTQPDNDACRALDHAGACWGVIAEKYRLILFGRYPFDEQWRPLVATLLMVAMLVASCTRVLWSRWLIAAWIAVLAVFFVLMRGGVAGLAPVETARWGGVPLTMLLSTLSIAAGFPIAVLVALGRRSHLPAIRSHVHRLCRADPRRAADLRIVHGLVHVPAVHAAGHQRRRAACACWSASRCSRRPTWPKSCAAGCRPYPKASIEAAAAMGLSYWQTQRKIILPQALRMVVPSIMNSFISTFKDTSLVTIVSLYELTGSLALALGGDANWRQFYLEGYLFIAAIYWGFCFAMSRYSQWVERRLNVANAH